MAPFNEENFNLDQLRVLKLLKKLQIFVFSLPVADGLKLMYISSECLEIVVYVDAAFVLYRDRTTPLGIMATIPDIKDSAASNIRYVSNESKQVGKSVLADVIWTSVVGFEFW